MTQSSGAHEGWGSSGKRGGSEGEGTSAGHCAASFGRVRFVAAAGVPLAATGVGTERGDQKEAVGKQRKNSIGCAPGSQGTRWVGWQAWQAGGTRRRARAVTQTPGAPEAWHKSKERRRDGGHRRRRII